MLSKLLVFACLLAVVNADIYLQYPKGSNNRLNEENRDRNNANRLFDSQNNNRGGYNVGNLYFYTGTTMHMEWTNQHSCGGPNNHCEIILQYTCDPRVRDGATTNTIPETMGADGNPTFGRHESYQYYTEQCKWRQRNRGLFVANRNLQGNGAIYTRQNENGARHGPLCLHPLLDEDARSNSSPFMKLMSCFHCFHCDCIIRWWNWTQVQSEKENKNPPSSRMRHQQGSHKKMEEYTAKCPVCRKVFLAKDIDHVLDLVGTGGHLDSNGVETDEDVLQSEFEKIRREKFEATLKLQQEHNGLIEPKKNEVLLPGMFLPQPVALPSAESNAIPVESRKKDPAAKSDINPGSSFGRPGPRKHRNFSNTRKHRTHAQNSGKPVRHWIEKDDISKK